MPASATQLGLIGFGQFGRFAALHLRAHFDILATDRQELGDQAARLGIVWGTLADVAACPVIVLAVPLQSMPAILQEISRQVQPGSLIIDVGSVKCAPERWMRQLLPSSVELIGTHPLFGPQSAAGGLEGHKIVLCPLRTSRAPQVREFLEGLGLEVVITDSDTHDRQIARTQGLVQYLGRALVAIECEPGPVRTPAYDVLMEIARIVGEDSWELFEAIQTLNPHAAEVRERVRAELRSVTDRLGERIGNHE